MAEQLIKIFNLHGYLNDWTTLGKFCISGLSMEYIPIVFKLNILATTGTYIVGNIKATTQLYTFLQLVSRNSWSSFWQDATCSSHFKTKQRKKENNIEVILINVTQFYYFPGLWWDKMEIGWDKNMSWRNSNKNSDNSNLDWQQIISYTILAEASLQLCTITIWLHFKIKYFIDISQL